jgi:peptide/nickel transport system substrate-binding protein
MGKKSDELQEQLIKNYVSRRRFIQHALMASGGLAVTGFLQACQTEAPIATSTPPPAGATAAPTAASTATPQPTATLSGPKQGGTLITARSAGFTSLDPQLDATEGRARMSVLLYSNLVQMDNEGIIVPVLAESWDNPEPTTWIFNLRQGVKWHNGKDFTSEDVRYTLERLLDEDLAISGRSEFLPITEIITPDEYTVELTTDGVFAGLLSSFGGKYGAIVQQEAIEEFGDLRNNAVGTGPFMVEEWVPDSHLLLARNPDYFLEGQPLLDGIEWRFVPDEANIIAGLRAGTIHHALLEDRQLADLVQGDETLNVQTAFTTSTDSIWANTLVEPFHIPELRQAISLAIDRDEVMQAATGGYAVYSGLVTPALSEYALPQEELAELYQRDVPRALELMEQAGFGDGLTIQLENISSVAALTAAAQVVANNLRDIGIEAEIVNYELGQWIDRFVGREYGISMNTGSGALDPEIWYRYLHSQPGGVDWQSLNDPELDELTEQIRATLDVDERVELVHELQRRTIEKGSMIILYSPLAVEITTTNVKDYQPHPLNWSYNFASAWLDN